MNESTRQIEQVTGGEFDLQDRRRRRVTARIEHLAAMRQGQRRRMDPPLFAAGDLQHEHLMGVVMRREAGCVSGRDIDVGMHRVVELCLDRRGQRRERLAGAMEPRQ